MNLKFFPTDATKGTEYYSKGFVLLYQRFLEKIDQSFKHSQSFQSCYKIKIYFKGDCVWNSVLKLHIIDSVQNEIVHFFDKMHKTLSLPVFGQAIHETQKQLLEVISDISSYSIKIQDK